MSRGHVSVITIPNAKNILTLNAASNSLQYYYYIFQSLKIYNQTHNNFPCALFWHIISWSFTILEKWKLIFNILYPRYPRDLLWNYISENNQLLDPKQHNCKSQLKMLQTVKISNLSNEPKTFKGELIKQIRNKSLFLI